MMKIKKQSSRVLTYLYNKKIDSPSEQISSKELSKGLGISEDKIETLLEYLDKKGMITHHAVMADGNWILVEITDIGIDRIEDEEIQKTSQSQNSQQIDDKIITSSPSEDGINWTRIGSIAGVLALVLIIVIWNWPSPPWKLEKSDDATSISTINKVFTISLETLRARITVNKFSTNYDTLLKFRVGNLGSVNDNTIPSLDYYYWRINQSKNTCGQEIHFFNKSKPLCHLHFDNGPVELYCQTNTPLLPPTVQKDIEYSLDTEASHLESTLSTIDTNLSCILEETIKVCAYYNGGLVDCTMPAKVEIKYKKIV